MKKSNFISNIETALQTYQAWDFGENEMLAQANTLRSLIKALHGSGNIWAPVEEIVVIVCTGDARSFQVPEDVYSQATKSGRAIKSLKSIPEHFAVEQDMAKIFDGLAELLSEQEFFRSRGYAEYDSFQLAQEGKTHSEWVETQAKIEGKPLEDFYKQLFDAQKDEPYKLDSVSEQQEQSEDVVEFGDSTADALEDARVRTVASVVRRQGQPEFRQGLIKAYNSKCAISSCDAVPALEAAHIMPYRGQDTNQISNGLLLRADLHTLFDLGLIAVDAQTMTILISEELANTAYVYLAGKPLRLPQEQCLQPNRKALDTHRAQSKVS